MADCQDGEECDGLDNDCDTFIDDEDSSLDTTSAVDWFLDDDGDEFGDAAISVLACDLSDAGYVEDDTDCNDADDAVNPGADEICDSIDNDCDGSVDEGVGSCYCF